MNNDNNSGSGNTGDWNSGNWNSGNWNSGDRNSGYRNSGDWNTGNWNTGDWNTGDRNTGDWNTGDRNTGYGNSGDWNTGDWNTGDWNSGNWNSGNWNSGDRNSGDRNTGYGNSADRQSGIFNNQEGTVRCFNKDTNLKWSEIDHPNFSRFYLNRWVKEGDMTEQEKKDNPEFSTTGGYLKTFTYEEAWANFWRDTTEENKQRILKLPNFDAEVFKDITGIDVEEPAPEEPEQTIELNGKKYKLVEV